jgi:ABC-type branched-subunit amino acid transport system ATPase component
MKRFEDVTAVDGVSLQVERSELFGLLGPNGAGKLIVSFKSSDRFSQVIN